MSDRHTLAQKLLNGYQSKAVELLMDYLRDDDIKAATERYIGQHDPSPAHPGASPTHSHRHSSSLPQRSIRQSVPGVPHGLQTPSNSAGSVKSHGSSLTALGVEKIWLLSHEDAGKDYLVISRSAPGRDNLIRERALYNRGFGTDQIEVNESVTVPGRQRAVSVRAAVNLTWRRPEEAMTSMDTFYIVPEGLLDSDVVLGSDESIEGQYPSEAQEAPSPHGRGQSGFRTVDELDTSFHPQAPTVPMQSCQQPYQPPSPDIQRAYEGTGAISEVQRVRGSDPPAPAVPSAPTHYGQTTRAPLSTPTQGDATSELQMDGLWGRMPISMSFDPGGSGEEFFQAFQRWATQRKRGENLDRQRLTMLLRANEDVPEEEAYFLSLDEGELEKLWKTAARWIRKNKSSEAPHLYATVEMAER